jgi:hypothetical protein
MFQTAAGPSKTSAEASLSSRAQPSSFVVEHPIETNLPTTFSDLESTDLQTTSAVIPTALQPHEASFQRGALSRTVDPVSDSSDSGYDSISLAAVSTTAVHNELHQEYFDPDKYLDLSDYSHVPEPTTSTALQAAQTHTDHDHSMWSFADPFLHMNNANLDELDYTHGMNQAWQY